MRGFAEVLLLVACTLIPSLFANGLQGLLPTINHGRGRRNAVIRGLLVSRQGICETGFVVCEAIGCCPIGWNCCDDGNCCDPTTVCTLGSNNVIGCCPIGDVCSGPAGNPTTINEPPPPPTTPALPPPTTTPINTLPSPTPSIDSAPPPTPTFNSAPPTQTIVPPVPSQSTVNSIPNTPVPTTSSPSAITIGSGGSPASTSGLPHSAAGRAQLYQPLLLLVGILLAAMC